MERILRMAAAEVLGEEGLRVLLGAHTESHAGRDEGAAQPTISYYMESLEEVFGQQAGRGIARRVGRACFPHGLREYGNSLGLTQTSFRLLPFPKKLKTLSAALSMLLQEAAGRHLAMEESAGMLLWHMDGCPLCDERHTNEPACHLAVGLAEESLYWVSGGKIFQVEESACVARGDPRCTLQIDMAPIS